MRLFRRYEGDSTSQGMYLQPVNDSGQDIGQRISSNDNPQQFEIVNGFINNPENPNYGLYEDPVSPEELFEAQYAAELIKEKLANQQNELMAGNLKDNSDAVDKALVRFAGDYVEKRKDLDLESLINRARNSLQAEADGYISLDKSVKSYGNQEALAEQSKRVRKADEERYGGERPYLVDKAFGVDSKSQTAEMKRNRALIMEGKLPKERNLPFDSFLSSEMRSNVEGIAGRMMPTSEARVQTTPGYVKDPLLDVRDIKVDEFDGTLERKGGITEYLSKEGFEELYNEWKSVVQKENRSNRNKFKAKTDKQSFNEFLTEYYGQQALRVANKKSPKDSLRSKQVVDAGINHPSTTLKTQRLLEMSNSLLNPEIKNAADFRWINNDGQLVIADNQSRIARPGQEPTLRINFAKSSDLNAQQQKNFKELFIDRLNKLSINNPTVTLDTVYKSLVQDGYLPDVVKTTSQVKNNGGIRAGKLMSSAPFMGRMNSGETGRQYRMDKILYTLMSGTRPDETAGVPIAYHMLDTKDARLKLAQNPEVIEDIIGGKLGNGKLDIVAKASSLHNKRILEPLLTGNDLIQIMQPYSL